MLRRSISNLKVVNFAGATTYPSLFLNSFRASSAVLSPQQFYLNVFCFRRSVLCVPLIATGRIQSSTVYSKPLVTPVLCVYVCIHLHCWENQSKVADCCISGLIDFTSPQHWVRVLLLLSPETLFLLFFSFLVLSPLKALLSPVARRQRRRWRSPGRGRGPHSRPAGHEPGHPELRLNNCLSV